MKTSIFLIIVLLSGASAGLVYGTVNYLIVEPYLDQASELEIVICLNLARAENTPDFQVNYEGYRVWQKSGQILAGVIYGMSVGSLFGIVYAVSRNSLPGNHDLKKSLALAGIMWLTLYLIPFLKYPANPPLWATVKPYLSVSFCTRPLLQSQGPGRWLSTNCQNGSRATKNSYLCSDMPFLYPHCLSPCLRIQTRNLLPKPDIRIQTDVCRRCYLILDIRRNNLGALLESLGIQRRNCSARLF